MTLGAMTHISHVQIFDTGRQYYASHARTLARHPSQTTKRFMAQLIAVAAHAHEYLTLIRGIADSEEPDLWLKDLTDRLILESR